MKICDRTLPVLISLFVFVVPFGIAHAQVMNQGMVPGDEEKALRQRAKNRTYPGGKDEEPIKVQLQLSFALRKMQPVQEAPESGDSEPAGAGETD